MLSRVCRLAPPTLLLVLLAACSGRNSERAVVVVRPNIVFILADDLGYGDLGVYGQRLIRTPNLDRLAERGIRFDHFYAGATVCAPSRSVLMTGLHTGHTPVRGNAGPDIQTLAPGDVTIAERLQEAGYRTGLIGKWGLGDEGNTGRPNDQGFDYFFGYLNQVHAHNYYPEFLWRDTARVQLNNVVERVSTPYGGFRGGAASEPHQYSHDLFVDEAIDFVSQDAEAPFFLYLSVTIPHANNEAMRVLGRHGQEVPDYGEYADTDWPDASRGTAAMVSRMDAGVGEILAALEQAGVADRTVVFFSSDNGPHAEGGNDPEFFNSSGPFRGTKRDLYEGGIRVPFIAYYPDAVREGAGVTSDYVGYFADIFPTFESLAGLSPTDSLDGLSIVPTLTGHPNEQPRHDHLYWEFYERGSAQAVRRDNWKMIRKPMFTGDVELYDLDTDQAETQNVSGEHPDVVAELAEVMDNEHESDARWTVR